MDKTKKQLRKILKKYNKKIKDLKKLKIDCENNNQSTIFIKKKIQSKKYKQMLVMLLLEQK